MNTSDRDIIESLLSQARPRPAPPAEHEASVRSALEREWQAIVARRRRRSVQRTLAMAASLVVAVALAFTLFEGTPPRPVNVAHIDASLGSIYVMDNGSGGLTLNDADNVHMGQIIDTRNDSALGLLWHSGGSLRIGPDSRVEFVDQDTVFLHRGVLYFDSMPGGSQTAATLEVDSSVGKVTHFGTQYMAERSDGTLFVSVREGEISVAGQSRKVTARAGERLAVSTAAPPQRSKISAADRRWRWTESVSPRMDTSGRTARGFLEWLGREIGYRIVFDSPAARAVADNAELSSGPIDVDLRTELRLRLLSADLDCSIDDDAGIIRISLPEEVRP